MSNVRKEKNRANLQSGKDCSAVVIVRASIVVIKKHDQKQLEEKRIYFSIELLSHTFNTEKSRQREAIEECCLLACSSWLAQTAYLHILELTA